MRHVYLVLSNTEPSAIRRKAATDQLVEKNVKHDSWPIQPDILSPPLLRLTSRKPLWLDLQPVDIKSRWRHNWKSAQVVNSHLVCDTTIRQLGFDPSATVVSAEPFLHGAGHCGACRRKWRLTDTDLCPCGETQMMSHIVESCPMTKLNGGLSRLHSDEDAVSWLTSYGSWHAYKKNKWKTLTNECNFYKVSVKQKLRCLTKDFDNKRLVNDCNCVFHAGTKVLNTLNMGSVKELKQLQTIGAKRAELIINFRKRVGQFSQVNGRYNK